MATDIGPRIGVQGEAEFRTAINQAAATVKAFDAEMKQLTAEFAGNEKSQEALTQKSALLKSEIGAVKDKIAEQEKALAAARSATGENSTETAKWREALANSKTQLANLNNELDQTEKDLDKAGKAADGNKDKFKKFGDTMKKVGTAVAAVAAAAAGAAIALGTEVVSAYADYEQLVGGVETLFGEAAGQVEKYADEAFKAAGMSANEYMETVTGMSAALISAVGGNTYEAANLANQAIIDMSDNANKMGSDIESIKNAYAGFAKGQFTMLDNLKLGYGGTKTEMERLLKDAEAISGVHYDVSSYADVVKAIHVIQESMGIAGATAEEAESTISGSIGTMNAAIQNLLTGLGNADADIETLVSDVADAFGNVVSNITPVVENLVEALPTALTAVFDAIVTMLPSITRSLIDLVNKLLVSLAESLPGLIAELSKTVAKMLPDVMQTLVDVVVAIIDGLAETLPQIMPVVVDGVVNAILTLLEPGNLMKLIEAVIKVAIGVVAGLVEALPKLLMGLIDAIVDIIFVLVELTAELIYAIAVAIDDGCRALWDSLSGWLSDVFDRIGTWFADVASSVSGFFTSIGQKISQAFSGIVENVGGFFGSIFEKIASGFSRIFADVGSFFADLGRKLSEIGKNLIDGLWNGIKEAWDRMWGWLKDLGTGLVDGFKALFGIHSPSTVFADIGENLAEGLGVGFDDKIGDVKRDILKRSDMSGMTAKAPTVEAGDIKLGDITGGSTGDVFTQILEYVKRIAEFLTGSAGTVGDNLGDLGVKTPDAHLTIGGKEVEGTMTDKKAALEETHNMKFNQTIELVINGRDFAIATIDDLFDIATRRGLIDVTTRGTVGGMA